MVRSTESRRSTSLELGATNRCLKSRLQCTHLFVVVSESARSSRECSSVSGRFIRCGVVSWANVTEPQRAWNSAEADALSGSLPLHCLAVSALTALRPPAYDLTSCQLAREEERRSCCEL